MMRLEIMKSEGAADMCKTQPHIRCQLIVPQDDWASNKNKISRKKEKLPLVDKARQLGTRVCR